MAYRLANVAGRAALVHAGDYFDLETISGGAMPAEPMRAIERSAELHHWSADLGGATPTGKLADADLLAPVPRPTNCFGIGLNYRNHAEESRMPIPDAPMVFTKYPSCIVGPAANVEMRSDYVDFEGELVAIIGKTAKNIAVADALEHVAGLCVGQDISDRPAQFTATPPQFNLGKSFDTYGPMGPVLVSMDLIAADDPLMLTTQVNGEVRQHDSARDLIFDVPDLVSYLSHILTLHPGDVIYTGTPGGVGVAEGRFLKDGDVITTTIEGLGSITNRCVRVADHPRADFVPEGMRKMLDKAAAKASG